MMEIFCTDFLQAMSPDGEAIVTGAGDETLRFWNVFSKTRSTKVSLGIDDIQVCSMDTFFSNESWGRKNVLYMFLTQWEGMSKEYKATGRRQGRVRGLSPAWNPKIIISSCEIHAVFCHSTPWFAAYSTSETASDVGVGKECGRGKKSLKSFTDKDEWIIEWMWISAHLLLHRHCE